MISMPADPIDVAFGRALVAFGDPSPFYGLGPYG